MLHHHFIKLSRRLHHRLCTGRFSLSVSIVYSLEISRRSQSLATTDHPTFKFIADWNTLRAFIMSTVASQSHQTSAYMQPAAGVHVGLDSHPSGTLKSRCAPLREHGETSEPQQEIMGTLPPEFRLSNTKAEVKGGVHQ